MYRKYAKLAIFIIAVGGIRGLNRLKPFRTFGYKLCIQISAFEIVIKYQYAKFCIKLNGIW